MKTIFVLSILLMTSLSFAKAKGDEFTEKFLFTHLHVPTKPKPINQVSKCFKFNKPSKEILQSYDHCKADPKLPSPLDEAQGTCVRKKDGANAYFFEDIKECESARTEVLDSLNSEE